MAPSTTPWPSPIDAPNPVAALPGAAFFEGLRFRIDPDKAAGVTTSAGFKVADTGETIGLIIRNGIVEPTNEIPADSGFVVELPKLAVIGMLFVDLYRGLAQAVDENHATLTAGALTDAENFFSYFDPKPKDRLADR